MDLVLNNLQWLICHQTKPKGEGAVDHSTVAKWFKEFLLGCKNLDDQVR